MYYCSICKKEKTGKSFRCASCAMKGRIRTPESIRKQSETRKKLKITAWNKGKKIPQMSGENAYQWKGGLPKCINCGKELSWYRGKYCRGCSNRLHPKNWQGGLTLKPGYFAFLEKRRNIKKLNNGGSHTLEQWEELKKKYNYMCLCCKRYENEIILTEDHIIPVSKGGRDDILNIQPLCNSCNSIKHTKTINYISLLETNETI